MSLSIEFHPPGKGSQRADLRGRLDTHTYEDLDEALAPLLTRQLHSLVLDLSGLEYISSAGIRSIFKARKTLAPHGGKVLLVNPQPQIQKVFGGKVFKTVITKSVRLEESPAYKESIFTFAPDSTGATEYYRLCEEVIDRA